MLSRARVYRVERREGEGVWHLPPSCNRIQLRRREKRAENLCWPKINSNKAAPPGEKLACVQVATDAECEALIHSAGMKYVLGRVPGSFRMRRLPARLANFRILCGGRTVKIASMWDRSEVRWASAWDWISLIFREKSRNRKVLREPGQMYCYTKLLLFIDMI